MLTVQVEATIEDPAYSQPGGAVNDAVDSVVVVQFDQGGTIRVDRVAEFLNPVPFEWTPLGVLERASKSIEERGDNVGLKAPARKSHTWVSEDRDVPTPDPAPLSGPAPVSRLEDPDPRPLMHPDFD